MPLLITLFIAVYFREFGCLALRGLRTSRTAPKHKMASGPHTTLAVEDGVAIITLINPPVNALHPNGGCSGQAALTRTMLVFS